MVLTQTHPAAPYVCRTGKITLRCQYDGVEGVLGVIWVLGNGTGTSNPSTFPGHTALPPTTTYQEVVVDSYTNLRESYQCGAVLTNGTVLLSNVYQAQIECKLKVMKHVMSGICGSPCTLLILNSFIYLCVTGIYLNIGYIV